MINRRRPLFSALIVFGSMMIAPFSAALEVVTTIKPIHALVASVMGEVGGPYLIVRGSASPHTYTLRPSDASALEKAELVFWVGHDLEAFLSGPLETIAAQAKIIEFEDSQGLSFLPFREGGPLDGHEDELDQNHEEAEHGHDHGVIDIHFWLDPLNAMVMVLEIAAALADADPQNGETYRHNAAATNERIEALILEISDQLRPIHDKPFVVFHDAYQYFENRFGLKASGSITINPDAIPGVQRIAEMQHVIKKLGAACVFAEPQFEPKLVQVVTEGSNAKSGVLDPLGSVIDGGPNHYFDMMRALASSMVECLSDS